VKYVLVDRGDNIVDKTEVSGDLKVAKEFFLARKQIDKKEFNNIWKVMTEEQYDLQFKASLQNRQIEWWKEDKEIVDDELKV
tara:strand:- start:3425 stop:3670 length:246 start_codon:yes stop_codon:yes gene_type:complete